MSNHEEEQPQQNCCELSYQALADYIVGQAQYLNITYPAPGTTTSNAMAILQGEAAVLLASTQSNLNTLLTNNCKCNCCQYPAITIAAANLSALAQASFITSAAN